MESEFLRFPMSFGPSGVYLLLREGKVVYAGKSTNVFARIATHYQRMERRNKNKAPFLDAVARYVTLIKFDEVWIKRCHRSMLDAEELALIQQHLPEHNVLMKRQPQKVPIELESLKSFHELERKYREPKRRKVPPPPKVVARIRSVTLPKVKFLEDVRA